MAYEQRDGQGALFKADKEGVENRPDYKGSITIGGAAYWLSAWLKTGDKGKWLSLSAQLKENSQKSPAPKAKNADPDEDVPF